MRAPLVAAVFAVVLFAGCSGSSEKCTPGASTACVGAGGCTGGQTCNAEGTGFGACDCGGQTDAGTDAGTTDAGTDAGTTTCNLAANTGCPQGNRCTLDFNSQVVCAPAGLVAANGPCTFSATTNVDNCQAGLGCINGFCRAFCTLSPDSCAQNFACTGYTNVDDGSGNVGACEPTCDPVTQVRRFDSAPACGSPNPAAPTLGCYGQPNERFSCLPVPAGALTQKHRDVPLGPAGGGAYINGCAPGYLPLIRRSTADATPVCIALCTPSETFQGQTANIQGLAPHTCPARGATAATEECRYLWMLEDTTQPATENANIVGFCFDYTQYDQQPSCSTLAQPNHLAYACGPRP